MEAKVNTVEEYLESIDSNKKVAFENIRAAIKENLPAGFTEVYSYGMIGYVIPHSLYPAGYHCNPSLPLPFINLAAQKNFIALYHMGIYGDDDLLQWFISEFPKHTSMKLDMGKSCIRFKKFDNLPLKLIGELASKMTVDSWIAQYERLYKSKK